MPPKVSFHKDLEMSPFILLSSSSSLDDMDSIISFQYVDDILLRGPTEETISRGNTESLLNFFGGQELQGILGKAQAYETKVTYLNLILPRGTRALGLEKSDPFLPCGFPKPFDWWEHFWEFQGVVSFGPLLRQS